MNTKDLVANILTENHITCKIADSGEPTLIRKDGKELGIFSDKGNALTAKIAKNIRRQYGDIRINAIQVRSCIHSIAQETNPSFWPSMDDILRENAIAQGMSE